MSLKSSSEKIRIGVVGVGHLGFHHARLLKRIPGAQLMGISDTNPDRLKWASRKLRTHAFSSPQELSLEVDAVSICVPTQDHYAVALPFLEKSIHTFIEKPITPSLEEADLLIQKAQENNRVLQVGHVERFNQAVQAFKQYPGQPLFVESHRLAPFKKRNLDIGVILDLMIHDLDIILGLVPSPIESIEAIGAPVLTTKEDIANARLRFANGCVANLTCSRLTHRTMRKIRVFQETCYLSIDYANQSASVYHKEGSKIIRKGIRIRKREPLKLELADFIQKIRGHEGAAIIDTNAREALAAALEITRQISPKIHGQSVKSQKTISHCR
jgi:predicted dehydrogenase